ncbi:MAG: hypothetical protein ABTQ26_11775 [Azonexus sp.]
MAESADEIMKRMSEKYGVGNGTEAPAPAPQPQPTNQPKQGGGLIQSAVGLISDRKKQLAEATKGFAGGGKIKGPGTPTSDSIPAQVQQTGEPIKVSTGERILSAKQDALLQRIAKLLGFDSVEALLEAGTGAPVGPTIKDGMAAAEEGGKVDPEQLMKDIAGSRGIDYQQPAAPTYTPPPTAAAAPKSNLQMVGEESSADIAGVNSVGAKINHAARGVLAAGPAIVADIAGKAAPIISPLITGRDPGSSTSAPSAPKAAPVAATATAPVPPVVAPAPAPGDLLLGRQQANMESNNLRSFQDVGGGTTASRGTNGRLNVTNVGTGDITDPTKRAVDDSASAQRDLASNGGRTAATVLENMQRLRLSSDARDNSLRPELRNEAAKSLADMNAATTAVGQSKLANAQADLATTQSAGSKLIQGLQQEALDDSNPRREAAMAKLKALTGKRDEDVFDAHVVKGQIGEPDHVVTTNRRNGQPAGAWTGTDAAKVTQKPSFTDYAKNVRAANPGKNISDEELRAKYGAK